MLPGPAFTLQFLRLVRVLLLSALAMLLVLAVGVATAGLRDPLILAELRRSGVASLTGASLLLGVAGLGGARVMLRARWRAQHPPAGVLAPRRLSRWRGAQVSPRVRLGRAARWPQVGTVALPALAACALAWTLRATGGPALVTPGVAAGLGAAALAVAFLTLVAERALAAVPRDTFPEAPALRALALVAVLSSFAAGLVEVASGLGLPATGPAARALAFVLTMTGIELAARATGRLFLPPPAPDLARAAVESVVAGLVCDGLRRRGIAGPIRQHLGLDFSRSWALGFVRAAALPLSAGLLLAAWGLTGVVVVPVDGRTVYERLGEPRAVLHPGLHVILPWPLGAVRPVEYGAIHEIPLGEGTGVVETVSAEAAAPASADRLWEQPHPGELLLLIASKGAGGQSFQSVAADLRLLYRVGLDDDDAWRSTYAAVDPEDLVRVAARATAASWFARHTLGDVLGTNRDAMAEELRGEVQAALATARSGLQVLAVVVEAVHPPAGAADAYHAVRAAEISADASIYAERGRASTIRAQSAQFATDQRAGAAAAAAEAVAQAGSAQVRFAADRDASAAGGRAFLLERYFAALAASLPRTPMTILDHRFGAPDTTVLDLRALPGATAAATSDGE